MVCQGKNLTFAPLAHRRQFNAGGVRSRVACKTLIGTPTLYYTTAYAFAPKLIVLIHDSMESSCAFEIIFSNKCTVTLTFKPNKGPKGPHIVHLSTMCHLC